MERSGKKSTAVRTRRFQLESLRIGRITTYHVNQYGPDIGEPHIDNAGCIQELLVFGFSVILDFGSKNIISK